MKIAGKFLAVCLLVIAGFAFLGAERPVKAYTYYEIDAELGYDNQAKYGRYVPVRIDIFSQEDFVGTISVQRVASDGSTQISTYPVDIAGPGNQVIDMQLPLVDKNREFVFVLKNSSGDEVKRKKESVEVLNSDYTELFIGVVDDDGTAKKLFNEKNIGEYSNTDFPYVLTRALTLKPSQIKGDFEYTLDCLDIIVVTDSSMKLLSDENIECLLNWVAAGNTLIMEHAGNFNPAFDGLYEEAFENRLSSDELLRPGLWVFGLDYEDGQIGFFTSFIEGSSFLSFAATNPELIGMIFRRNCSPERINNIIKADMYYLGKDDSYSVQYMLNTAIGKEAPDIKQYILVISLYILLVGPVLFLVLRKKDRSRFIFPLVLVFACIFSFVINKMGENTRFTDMFLQYASIVDIGKEDVNETTYICANVPYKDTYYMRVSDAYRVLQLTELRDSESEVFEVSDIEERIEFVYAEDEIKLILENNVPFSRSYLEASRRHENTGNWQLVEDITYYDGVFTGSVINESSKDYEYVAVIAYGKILLLGNLKAGERIDVYDATVLTLPYYSSDAADRIMGIDILSEEQGGDEDDLYKTLNGKAGIVEYVINRYFNTKSTSPVLIGFTDDREDTFRFDDRYEAFGFTMIYKDVDINTSIGNLSFTPVPYTDVENLDSSSSYDAYSNTTYSSRLRLQYKFDDAESLVRIIFDLGKEAGKEDIYYGTFDGTARFYNYETLAYDEVNILKEYFYMSELEPYLKEDGDGYTLTVQYDVSTKGQFRYTEVKLPEVSVVRRNVNVENSEP